MRGEVESRAVAGGSLLFFGGRVVGAAATFGVQVFLARWIGKSGLGRYVEAFAWCLILSDVALLGFPFAGLRFIRERWNAADRSGVAGFIRRTRQISLGASLALAAGCATVITVLWPPASHPGSAVILVALAGLPALTLLRHWIGVAHAFGWFRYVALPMTVFRPLLFLALLAAIWMLGGDPSATQVMACQVAVIVAVLIGLTTVMAPRLRSQLDGAQPAYATRLWLRTSGPLLFVSVFNGFFPEINVILVGLLAGEGHVAVFNAGIRTAFLIGFALQAVDQVTLPNVSTLFASGNRVGMQRLLTLATRMKFAAALAGMLVIAVFGERILAVFGEDFVEGHRALLILSLTQVVRAAIGPVDQILGLTGHQDASLIASGASLAAILALDAILVPAFGVVGAAIGVLVVTTLSSMWLLFLVVRHIGVIPSLFGPMPCAPSTSTADS
ncbi:MAG: oligosaccharide flippase family protein [bacterium]|nr:oligosaccharide flippase family protein [bacterium]